MIITPDAELIYYLEDNERINNCGLVANYVFSWYCIQILLLHITTMELDQALFPNQKDCHGTHTITCPAWYVVEHNRIYKNRRRAKKEWA